MIVNDLTADTKCLVTDILHILQAFQLIRNLIDGLGIDRVEHNVRQRCTHGRTKHSEFELIASEGNRGSTVAVGVVMRYIGKAVDRVEIRPGFVLAFLRRMFLINAVQDVLNVAAQINGNDCRRSLVGTQTEVVASRGCTHAQQHRIRINCLDEGTDEGQKADVLSRLVTWRIQVLAIVSHNRVVVMLAGTIDAIKRLFMQQAGKAVLLGGAAQDIHGQQVLINCNVALGENRGQLKL